MSHAIYRLLRDLEGSSIPFTLARDRDETIRVNVAIVGERVEIDVFEDGHMEVSRFRGSEAMVADEATIRQLIAENTE